MVCFSTIPRQIGDRAAACLPQVAGPASPRGSGVCSASAGPPPTTLMSVTLKVGVLGARGKVGRAVCEAVEAADDLELVAAHRRRRRPRTTWSTAGVEAVVDFTHPDVVMDNLEFCVAHGIHAVVGTTGFDDDRLDTLRGWLDASAGHRRAGRPQLLHRRVLMMRFAAEAARVLRVRRDRRAAPPRQGRRALRHRPAYGGADRRRPPRGRPRPGPRRHLDRARRGPRRRRRRHPRARPAGPGAGRAPGGHPRRRGGDPHHPARLARPGLLHPRRAARAAPDRPTTPGSPWASRSSSTWTEPPCAPSSPQPSCTIVLVHGPCSASWRGATGRGCGLGATCSASRLPPVLPDRAPTGWREIDFRRRPTLALPATSSGGAAFPAERRCPRLPRDGSTTRRRPPFAELRRRGEARPEATRRRGCSAGDRSYDAAGDRTLRASRAASGHARSASCRRVRCRFCNARLADVRRTLADAGRGVSRERAPSASTGACRRGTVACAPVRVSSPWPVRPQRRRPCGRPPPPRRPPRDPPRLGPVAAALAARRPTPPRPRFGAGQAFTAVGDARRPRRHPPRAAGPHLPRACRSLGGDLVVHQGAAGRLEGPQPDARPPPHPRRDPDRRQAAAGAAALAPEPGHPRDHRGEGRRLAAGRRRHRRDAPPGLRGAHRRHAGRRHPQPAGHLRRRPHRRGAPHRAADRERRRLRPVALQRHGPAAASR